MMKAVERYSALDNDVSVFGKILRNEIDEEFLQVQRQLKEAVLDLLRVHIKGKHPLKGDDVISTILQDKLQVGWGCACRSSERALRLTLSASAWQGTLQEEEWMDIVQYMYNHEVRGRWRRIGCGAGEC